MSTIGKAIAIAAAAHADQVDRGGEPYILHPLRVMAAVEGEHAKMAAVLHDVIEDTDVTVKDLKAFGIPDPVIKAVIYLTKLEGMSTMDAAMAAALDPIATVVKIADLKDNMDLSRISAPTSEDLARTERYARALRYLEAA